jgi:GcrA cell cycle regulator
MQPNNWLPEHSDALREFLLRGMSYSEIAAAINAKFGTSYTRNATIGRSKRMGLGAPDRSGAWPKPPPRSKAPKRSEDSLQKRRLPRTKRRNEPAPMRESVEPVRLRCVGIKPRLLSLIELDDGDCRYPYGGDRDGEAITFCGHPRLAGSRYCAPHCHLTRGDGTAADRAVAAVILRLVEAA